MSILTLFRKYGNLTFGNIEHHFAIFILYLISFASTIFCWKKLATKTKKSSISKIFIVFIASLLVNFILVFITDWLTKIVFGIATYNFYSLVSNAYALTIIFHPYAAGFVLTYLYFNQSKKVAVALEQIEKERANLQSQILQKNLEPHFLFNNLSVLSGLARKNPEQIESFIDDFSDVYRYYLKHGKKQLVELKEELLFLKNYINLMGKRFGNAYQIKNEIENTNGFIIPCSIQLCVENAIKHNKASEDNPLLIRLSRKGNSVFITNKLNKVDFTLGTGTGNNYLKRQYQINFDKEVVFTENDKEFVVEIPVVL